MNLERLKGQLGSTAESMVSHRKQQVHFLAPMCLVAILMHCQCFFDFAGIYSSLLSSPSSHGLRATGAPVKHGTFNRYIMHLQVGSFHYRFICKKH